MVNRRTALALLSGALSAPQASFAATVREITWDDLIPSGVPYSEIIGEGDMDAVNDTWNPIYDENGIKLNNELDGVFVKMPGFVVPFDMNADGVTSFMLVPYVGACIHTPPPPANQLVFVNTAKPWPADQLWQAIWVSGILRTKLQSTGLGQTGYSIAADNIEVYEW
ncbi:DUF3299 domain-containing protein [uncultured Pelagimonas sp.]|uniref:DUF3299 domain-containing protein n=1 Tax=uncultured Pelagimonas sp. TaxID=1618102 RepID=UPI00260E5355|nr:DUF3299 domain-containing protein [uncultured Pelagimonas sp.]